MHKDEDVEEDEEDEDDGLCFAANATAVKVTATSFKGSAARFFFRHAPSIPSTKHASFSGETELPSLWQARPW